MGDVVGFAKEKLRYYPAEDELFHRIIALIYEYEGQLAVMSAVGILELAKLDVLKVGYEGNN